MTNCANIDEIIEIELSLIENKTIKIKCPKKEAQNLQKAALIVKEKVNEAKSKIKVIGADKLSQIAALNIAYDLIKLQNQQIEMNQRLSDFVTKIESNNIQNNDT